VTCQVLIVYPDEVDARVRLLAGDKPTGVAFAQAVHEFLQAHQPWLAERVAVQAGKDCALIRPVVPGEADAPGGAMPGGGTPDGTAREGERPGDILRALEAALGMMSKLPEVLDADGLREIEVDPDLLRPPAPVPEGEEDQFVGLLRSNVRSFPLPGAEWYEIHEGQLVLMERSVLFEPRHALGQTEDDRTVRRHEIPLADITGFGQDTWIHYPCLRIETERRTYRYGWPARRRNVWSDFNVEEWLVALESALSRRRQS